MKTELLIATKAGPIFEISNSTQSVTYTTNRTGDPGKLEFTLNKSGNISFFEGDVVRFSVDGTLIFYGWVFTKSKDRWDVITVTCYDRMRYLKASASYAFYDQTAGEIIRQIAQDFQLDVSELEDTGYKIPSLIEEEQTCLDIIEEAVQQTLLNTGKVYVFFDDGSGLSLKEAGNMITLAAMIAKIEGNTKYVDKYWNILKIWTDYLVENGQDPANQLCTDDFAGHWAHNCNLSIKAIMGVAGFAEMARIKGDAATADKYMNKAKEMAAKWEKDAREDDHYRLAFDRENTWSQKYNMVWDKLWNINIFPNDAMQREIKYYLKMQNRYGLPLDSRKDYTKNDWIMWTAAMAPNNKTFLKFVHPVYDYINETESRVPISDWYDTKTGLMTGFKARSVIGGFWMKVLADKLAEKK